MVAERGPTLLQAGAAKPEAPADVVARVCRTLEQAVDHWCSRFLDHLPNCLLGRSFAQAIDRPMMPEPSRPVLRGMAAVKAASVALVSAEQMPELVLELAPELATGLRVLPVLAPG